MPSEKFNILNYLSYTYSDISNNDHFDSEYKLLFFLNSNKLSNLRQYQIKIHETIEFV